jgi:hypothetical protein
MICKGTMPFAGPHQHPLDPCALVIVGHADKEWRDQKEQTFYCHFECFRRLLGDGVLYINDADFATNGEAADERTTEEAAAEQRQAEQGADGGVIGFFYCSAGHSRRR